MPPDSSSSAASLLTPNGYQCSDCGYCKEQDSSQRTPDSRASYYVFTKRLSPAHYQELVDRGWRRSGTVLYLPDVYRSCCPHYTIRLRASEFKPTRDQRQALYRWNRYVLGDKYISERDRKYPKTKEEKKRLNNAFDLQANIHESEKSSPKPDIPSDHVFEVTLEPDNFTEEKFALFAHYQKHVHHEDDSDISPQGFKRFLCASPLTRSGAATSDSDQQQQQQLGTYHQCYRLDGRLVALGVLDLLPHAVSAVYFLYHADFERWSLGKLSALREASLALEQGYEYYYMGYYIHGCAKMRYKAEYRPQQVLDLADHTWNPLDDDMRGLMEREKFASPARERKRLAAAAAAAAAAVATDAGGRMEAANDETEFTFTGSTDAFSSARSLLDIGMPGVVSRAELHERIDVNSMRVLIGRPPRTMTVEMQDLASWDLENKELDLTTLEGHVTQYAAAVGPLVAREAVVTLS